MIKSSKDNNELGRKMENNAKKFLKEATSAFDKIDTERENIKGIHSLYFFNIDFSQKINWDLEVINVAYFYQFYIGAISMLENGLEENNRIIAENSAKIYEAQNHATALETQVL